MARSAKRKLQEPKLRVLFAGISWPVETFIVGLIRGLADAGVEVSIASEINPSRNRLLDHPGILWLRTPSWKVSAAARLLWLGWLTITGLQRGRRDLRRFNFYAQQNPERAGRLQTLHQLLPFAGKHWDVIYFPWNSAAISYLPLFDMDAPVVISCRGSQINIAPHVPSRAGFRDDLRATFALAANVHCVSEAIRAEASNYGLDTTRSTVIRPAVNPEFFYPAANRANGKFRIVTTGNLVWLKGHEYALMSIRQLVDSGIDVQFDIIGDGPERQQIRYTIQDLGLEQQVRLHGGLDQKRVREILQRADAFLLSSFSEGISNAVLEAMACGLPVVTTDCGGMREVIADGTEGFVVPLRDPHGMANRLATLARNPKLRDEMGKAARQTVKARFNLSNQVQSFRELYHKAVNTPQN
jgi:colanic acid/amylovoran biosynthesis glycosyltransferase